ncbi:MAG: M48 family metallopeptidase [Oxalobacter sp.]|nr:M48 family metallopeptidase [Oxalobacter sp.]
MGRRKVIPDSLPLQLDMFASDVMQILLPPLADQAKDTSFDKSPENPAPTLKKRAIEFSGIRIEYEFRRSKRRTIGFLVNENGLRVTAPRWATLKSVEEAIREKESWITSKLHYFLHQYKKRQETPLQLENGTILPYLGDNLLLRLQNGPANNILMNDITKELFVTSSNAEQSTIEENLRHWFQEKARQFFAERMPVYAAMLGVNYCSFSLSSARQRWGSCSISGNIRLNWRLIYFSPSLIDYVIVHELAHLREMNHSKRFWEIVSQAYPDYRAARKALNQQNSQILALL